MARCVVALPATNRVAPNQRRPVEIEVVPTVSVLISRWLERRSVRMRVESARSNHSSVDVGFNVVERDATIGGGLLAGALAYRLFVLLLPTVLLLVSGLGLYAGAVDKSTAKVAEQAGLHGLIASEVASTASGRARGAVFLVMIPAVALAALSLYGATARVHGIVWQGSARGVRVSGRGVAVFAGALVLQIVAVAAVGWIRRGDQFGGVAALLVYLVLVGGTWLMVSLQLPARARTFLGALSYQAQSFSVPVCCSSTSSTSTSQPDWSKVRPISTAPSGSQPPCSSPWCSSGD